MPRHYRLRRRDDDAFFGFAAGAQSAKPVFFPTDELLWRGRRARRWRFDRAAGAGRRQQRGHSRPLRPVGVRSCDRSAIAIHDTGATGYGCRRTRTRGLRRDGASRRGGVARTRRAPASASRWAPAPDPRCGSAARFDLSLTELLDGGAHRFVVEVGSERGAEVLNADISAPTAPIDDFAAADEGWPPRRQPGWAAPWTPTGSRNCSYASVESPSLG